MCRQSDIRVRRALRKYRVGSIIQLGILGYVAVALPYWTKVGHVTCSLAGCAWSPHRRLTTSTGRAPCEFHNSQTAELCKQCSSAVPTCRSAPNRMLQASEEPCIAMGLEAAHMGCCCMMLIVLGTARKAAAMGRMQPFRGLRYCSACRRSPLPAPRRCSTPCYPSPSPRRLWAARSRRSV